MPWVPALVRWMMDRPDLEGRISEIEALRRAAANLAHANLSDPGFPQRERLLDRAYHDDAAGTVGERHGGGGKGAEYIDDRDGALRPAGAFEEALDRYFHGFC